MPVAGEAARGGHSCKAPSDDYDARHRSLHAVETESQCFSHAGSGAREEKTSQFAGSMLARRPTRRG
jgi:hypothetical protein